MSKGIFAAVFLCCFLTSLRAQLTHLPYRHYTIHDGLAQMQVMSLLQDSRGYIWAGTKAGLSRFNGERFENFHVADGLSGEFIKNLVEDAGGNVWAFTLTGCGYYDGVGWRKVADSGMEGVVLLDSLVLGWEPKTKTVWQLGKDTARVFLKLDKLPADSPDKDDGKPGFYFAWQSNEKAQIICKVNRAGKLTFADTIDLNKYTGLVSGGNEDYYVVSKPSSSGMCLIYRAGEKLPFDSVRFEGAKSFGDMYRLLYCRNRDAYFQVNRQVYFKPAGEVTATRLDLPVENVHGFMEDTERAVWIYAEEGLFQYFPNGFSYISAKDAPSPWGMVEDKEGSYWIAGYGKGLFKWGNGKIERVPLPPGVVSKQDSFFYNAPAKDHTVNLYFPHAMGLIQKTAKGFANLITANPINTADNTAVFISWFDAVDRKVLAGMQGGVAVYDPESGKLDAIPLDIGKANVLGIARDGSGNYWFSAGRGAGIVRYHIPTKDTTHFRQGDGTLPFNAALCIEYDEKADGLWFGTISGLYFYSNKSGNFRKVATASINGPVFNLKIADDLLLAGDLAGLFVLDLKAFHQNGTERVKAYNRHNGFLGIEPNQNASLLDSEGNYFVLGANQIAFIHKSKISLDDHPSKVRIHQINDRRVPYSGSGEIHLDKGINEVTIRFESIGFQRSLRTQYSWRLPGYLDEWSEWSEDQIAFLSNLPGGDYTFEVRSRHPGSEDSTAYETDKYAFTVSLPFYKEPNFFKFAFIGGGAAILLGAVGFWYFRRARREAREARLEAREREQQMKYYQIQTLLAQLNPHFLFNLLETIQNYVRKEETALAAEQIRRLSKLMRHLLESGIYSNLEKIRQGNQGISLASEVEILTYYIEMEQIQKPGMFEYSIEVDETLQPRNIFLTPMIIQPFVENAIKRGIDPRQDREGRLWLKFSQTTDGVRCAIEDNGIGREASRRLQEQSERKYVPRGGELVSERVRLLRDFGVEINIEISDRPDGGTVVVIDFNT